MPDGIWYVPALHSPSPAWSLLPGPKAADYTSQTCLPPGFQSGASDGGLAGAGKMRERGKPYSLSLGSALAEGATAMKERPRRRQ